MKSTGSLIALLALGVVAVVGVATLLSQEEPEGVGTRPLEPPSEALHAELADEESVSALDAPIDAIISTDALTAESSSGTLRSDLDLPAMSGHLLDPAGLPIAGARLSWTLVTPEDRSPDKHWQDLDREGRAEFTATCLTDAEGAYNFADAPTGEENADSVVWITHPDWVAKWIYFEAEITSPSLPSDLSMVPGVPLVVRCTDSLDGAVSDATIDQVLIPAELDSEQADQPERLDHEAIARRLFVGTFSTDEQGEASLSPVDGKILLEASLSTKISSPWQGVPTEPVVLILHSGFQVRGVVSTGVIPPRFDELRFHVGFYDEPNWSNFAWQARSLQVRPDGSFGPATFPIPDRSQVLFEVKGADVIRTREPRPIPLPGDSLNMEMEVVFGVSLDVIVQDEQGNPVPSAEVWCAEVGQGGGRQLTGGIAGPEGRIHLRGLPVGQLYVHVWAEAFLPTKVDALLPLESQDPFVITLSEAVTVEGVVVHQGEPVTDFTITYWSDADANADQGLAMGEVFSSEEGKFKLFATPGARLSLFASNNALPQCEVITVVATPELDEVVVELPQPEVARGLVLDGRTQGPMAGVEVHQLTSARGRLSNYRGVPPVITGEDGRFQAPGCVAFLGGFSYHAPGYAPYYQFSGGNSKGFVDCGIIVMDPLSSVMIVATGLESGDYSSLSVWNEQNAGSAPVALEADGTLSLPGLRAGAYTFHLRFPDGTTRIQESHVTPGSHQVVEFNLSGDAEIELTVKVDGGGDLEEGTTLEASFRTSDARRQKQSFHIPEDGKLTISHLPAGPVTLELLDSRGARLSNKSLVLQSGGPTPVTMKVMGVSRKLRLIYTDSEPVVDATMLVTLPDDGSGWYAHLRTNTAGEVDLGSLDEERITLCIELANSQGLLYGVPVQLERDPTLVTEVLLDLVVAATLKVKELGTPQAGVNIQLLHPSRPASIGYLAYITNEEGLLPGIPCGEGQLIIRPLHAAYWPSSTTIDIKPDAEAYSVEVYHRTSLDFSARSLEGLAVAGVRLELRHEHLGDANSWIEQGLLPPPPQGLFTDADGQLEVKGIPRGRYTWTATFPTGELLNGEALLEPKGTATIEARPL